MLSIGSCNLGSKPRIVAVVDECAAAGKLQLLRGEADILEMRIDCYQQPLDKTVHYLQGIRSKVGIPMIGTVRENEFTKHDRPGIFNAIMPYVDAIDIELGASISGEVVAAAAGKIIIVSEHDFIATPDVAGLQSMVTRAKEQGADIIKIATMAHTREDVVRLLEFTRACTDPIVTIAMSALGSVSRVIAPLFGSLFSYGFLTKPVAPGQLSVVKLVEEFRIYFPD